MGMYDVVEEIEHPDSIVWSDKPQQCVFCGRTVPAGNAAARDRVTSWFDWDDPDEDAQGQRRRSVTREWYCLAEDCNATTLAQGENARIEGLTQIISDPYASTQAERDQAHALLGAIARRNQGTFDLLTEIDEASRYDDNSPGQIGGGRR